MVFLSCETVENTARKAGFKVAVPGFQLRKESYLQAKAYLHQV